MRITTRLAQERRLQDVLRGQERLEDARDRVSSGQRISRPSDAPDQISELLRTRVNVAELQRRRDAADAWLPSMQASSSALQSMSDSLREVRNATLQAINGATSDEQRQVLADEVDQLKGRLVALANSQVEGRYLFAGTATQAEPFSAGPPVAYTGNGVPQVVSLSAGLPFATSITGDTLRNPRAGTDMFRNLTTLSAALRAGNTDAMSAGLKALDLELDNVVRLNGDMGSRIQYVQLMREQVDSNLTAAQERQSQLQDVDLAAAIIAEKSAENAHEAALAMAGRMDHPSLLDYLR